MDLQWAQIAVGALGGGAVGAIITATVGAYKSRVQPVAYQIRTAQLFEKVPGFRLTVTDASGQINYDDLYSVELLIQNTGNKDFPKFAFALDFATGYLAVGETLEGSDRLHRISSDPRPSHRAAAEKLDLTLDPFNRGDQYLATFVVAKSGTAIGSVAASIHTAEAVRLVRRSSALDLSITVGELLVEAAPSVLRAALSRARN